MTVENELATMNNELVDLKNAVLQPIATLDAKAQAASADAGRAEAARDEAEIHKDSAYQSAQDAASAVAYQDLSSISKTLNVAAIDLFIYDTTLDSDGGAWRRRCQHLSWFNEPLGTATRGLRREFPAIALIVVEHAKVTIFDADDPALPMWMVLEAATVNAIYASGNILKRVAAQNGLIAVAASSGASAGALSLVELASDKATVLRGGFGTYLGALADRNAGKGHDGQNPYPLVSSLVNDVAITVLGDAPIDPLTGLAIPTVVAATDGGLSIIRDDGTVIDSAANVKFRRLGLSGRQLCSNAEGTTRWLHYFSDIRALGHGFSPTKSFASAVPSVHYPGIGSANRNNTFAIQGDTIRVGSTGPEDYGLWSLTISGVEVGASQYEDMVCLASPGFTSGWMVGDIKGAWLSSNEDSDLVGGVDNDRSPDGLDLNVTGTLTRAGVANGAELMGYSGFSAGVNELTLTDVSISDTLYGMCWVEDAVLGWVLQHGVMNTNPIEGISISGTSLTVAGARPKALLRLSATTPSAEQLARIESDEKRLFQQNAACTLTGNSSAVLDIAHDQVTGLVHAVTSVGRSSFQGLVRVEVNTDAHTAPVAGLDGIVVEADTTQVNYRQPAINLREKLR